MSDSCKICRFPTEDVIGVCSDHACMRDYIIKIEAQLKEAEEQCHDCGKVQAENALLKDQLGLARQKCDDIKIEARSLKAENEQLEAQNKELADMYHSASLDAFDESEKVDHQKAVSRKLAERLSQASLCGQRDTPNAWLAWAETKKQPRRISKMAITPKHNNKETDMSKKQEAIQHVTQPEGDYVIVRCRNAGVHAGYKKERGNGVLVLENSRRLWRWWSKFTLSELAMAGVLKGKEDECRFACVVPEIELTESDVAEVIKCTNEARESIESIKEHTNE